MPQSFPVLCTPAIGGYAASSHHRRLRRFTAPQKRLAPGPSDLVPTITKQKSLCAPPRWLRHLTLASKLYVASHSYDRRLRRLFPPSAASPLRSSARETRPSGPSDLVPTITKQKSLCAPPRWLRHLAFANTSQLCAALHSYDRRLRRLFPPSAASPLRSSARETRPSGPSDLVPTITKQKSLCAPPRWLRHLAFANTSQLYVASHSYDRRLRRLFPPSAASPLRSSARETRPSGPSDLVPTITKQKSLCAPPRWLRHLAFANTSQLCAALHSYDRRLRRLFPPSAASPLRSSARETRPSGPSDLVPTITKQKSLCAPRWLRHLAFANTSQLCAALHSYDRRLRRLFPPSAASPLRSSARKARPSGPSDLVPTITKQKSLCAPRWLRHLTLASKLYVASHSYDRRLRRLFPPSAASPLRSSARETRPSGPSDLVNFCFSVKRSV
ncbi:hypothetical protein L596_012631 [Steinernema carpocapsae]|uniref:Uncharacterized protein n=1 Tax=Steinernema carpocapsae TaxID=34508 RepID=A0A4U5NXV2_STECR|nr:hypothetical protein L596_012631 [Steinernema carpocapsae]